MNRNTFRLALLLSMAITALPSGPALALFDRGGGLGVGTRAMGMAGAFVAVADDESAPYWNPAGLAQLDVPAFSLMGGSYFNDKNRNLFLGFHYPLPNDIHLGLTTNNLFFTDIPGAREDQYSGSVAFPLEFVDGKRLLVGANFRFLLAELGEGQGIAQGAGVDVGFLFRNPFPDGTEFRAGLALTDISTSIRFDGSGYEQAVPPVLTPGLAYRIDPKTLAALDAPWTLSDDVLLGEENFRLRGGLERWFFDGKLGLRAGLVTYLTLALEFSVGASYRAQDWGMQYAFMNHPEGLGNSHRLTASYAFNAGGPARPEPRPYMVRSFVGDEKIYLEWDIPEGSSADGYLVYLRTDAEVDFRRAKQEPVGTKYVLLRGAKNGETYRLYVRSVVDGKERFSCEEWVTSPRPMSENAKRYYDEGVEAFNRRQLSAALYHARKAEELDPNNYDIKNLIRKLETTHHEGLVPEQEIQ